MIVWLPLENDLVYNEIGQTQPLRSDEEDTMLFAAKRIYREN
jgi:hypothetical protein